MKIKNCVHFFLAILLLISGSTPVLAQTPDQCGSVEPVRPGDSVTDAVSDVPAAHVDLTAVETSLSGEALTVVFHLRDLPDTLRFNRTEHGEGSKEYEWEVAIDVDNDRGTGPGGFDTLLTAYHIAFMSHEGTDADVTAPIGEMLEAAVWTARSGGSTSGLADADLAVSAAEDTITITGFIPGITSASRLTFSAFDAGFAGEADQIDCHPSYRESMGPWGCYAGAALTTPGQTATDESEGVTEPHIDITRVETSLSGETLTAVFHLRDVPETLTFNRTGASENYLEYAWVVVVDVDNDRETGSGGFEYQMLASYSVPPSEEESNVKAPIANELKVSVWGLEPGRAVPAADAALEVSPDEDTITLSGRIPGITTASRLAFRTYDFAGDLDEIGCFTSQSQSSYPVQCDTDDAVAPGQTLVDETADVQAAHIDITKVETSLSGETLTAVFHLRDIPETLTFNRTGISENYGEYVWNVSIDVDGDRETGYGGIEYELSASHFVRSSEKGRNEKASIESGVKAGVLKARGDGFMSMGAATLEVSPKEDTLTLSGTIPGITAESQLTFRAYDYFSGSDRFGCPAGPGLDTPASRDAPPSPCTDDQPAVTPGQTATDDLSDVSAAYLDISKVSASLSGEMLTVMLRFRDIPETLTFNRTGTSANSMEYMWEVLVDVDADPETGDGGFEYLLSAYHIVRPAYEGDNTEAPIEEVAKASVWERRPGGGISTFGGASLEVSAETDTMILSGRIPGITPASRLSFRTHEYLGDFDGVGCPATPGRSTPENQNAPVSQCTDAEPTVAPGTTATDDISDVSAAYLDISKVSTSLSGEVLTVMFRFRDIPETLTFNRTGTSANSMEYMWEVLVDVDADPETGDGGFEYLLSAHHIVWPGRAGDNTEAPIVEVAKADVWERHSGGRTSVLQDARLEVSAETDTMILSGRIPGITPASRLSFRTQEHLSGSDDLGCQEPPNILTSSSQCDRDGAVTPGESVSDDVSDALAAHLDVTEISTSLSGETLTVVFQLRDVPETLTFGRTGVPENMTEYSWEVSIDVDGDQETGLSGFEYVLSASHVVFPGASGRDLSAALSSNVLQTNTWALNPAGNTNFEIPYLEDARIWVSVEEDTIKLSGEIPGITAESQLAFGVYDYLGGAEEVGCLTPFGLGRPASFLSSVDGSEAATGRSVSEDVSHDVVGLIDIHDVTTTVDGETLTVTFQLGDVPEMLTFDRTGVPAHALEYGWEVSIDVDNDPDTGVGGFDYMLSAGYFVHPLVRNSNTVAQVTDPGFVTASIWGLDREGNRVLAEADIEVSADDNTLTLSGDIPGITEDSPLRFKAYDYYGGSVVVEKAVKMSSHGPSITGVASDTCRSDSAVIRPGQRVVDAVSETLPAYMDITEVSTALTDDGRLVVVFHLRDVPETLEFNRKGVRENALEYSWGVSVDVVDDRETGLQGADYSLSASYFVFSPSSDEGVHQPIEEAVQADTWKMDPDGLGAAYLSSADIEVSAEENTITLVGDIPGITSASRLEFEAYDFLHGSEQVACQGLSIVGGSE